MQGNHTLVTGGYDGLLVVWNTDSGAIHAHLSPPGLAQRPLQERSVEQVSTASKTAASICLLEGSECSALLDTPPEGILLLQPPMKLAQVHMIRHVCITIEAMF